MTVLLNVSDLRKSYGALKVTDSVDLQVEEGMLHALIGPNGAGKTTLISQLSGQLRPDSGHVVYDGKDVTHLSMPQRVRRGLARSFQITSILPSLSLLENVAVAAQARDGSSFRFLRAAAAEAALNDEAMRCLAEVGLSAAPHRLAGSVSHGEKRQLEIAIALATRPRMLLLDEPLAGTGPQESEILVEVMQRLKGRVTMLLIEHDMDAVFALADRISVLVYGRVAAEGSPEHIRTDPKVRAAYLGEEEGAA
ncbi:ABC transporter ATP-binding protein [Rhodovulum sp. DZ06]|uniref:ABC transporter ATP-binding protein n=1 Tax=Rhodovulum sp. DZ06 TaxID=3425126 RepID=UPI003D34F854